MRIVFDLVQTWSIHEHSTHVLSHVIVPLLVEATPVQKNVIAACVILAINVHLIVRFPKVLIILWIYLSGSSCIHFKIGLFY